jgi:hypothetical protein
MHRRLAMETCPWCCEETEELVEYEDPYGCQEYVCPSCQIEQVDIDGYAEERRRQGDTRRPEEILYM